MGESQVTQTYYSNKHASNLQASQPLLSLVNRKGGNARILVFMAGPDPNFDEISELIYSKSRTSFFSDLTPPKNLDSETPVQLRDWSAQDFSNIYVRFRPHLVTHARKFLSNPSIIEEVVQDAFLYLMTALPDLDSEVGVIRFLKWKTRLLCLDAIRAQSGNPIRNADQLDESTAANESDPSVSIERADDAAIVRLALAQLSPRHREALVATVFEEKTSRQVALEMGLSENAFRQLLLRARRSFKAVFVGEAEAANMSVSEALNLAAKRHRLKLISGSSLAVVLFTILTGAPTTLPSREIVMPSSEPATQLALPAPAQAGEEQGSKTLNSIREEPLSRSVATETQTPTPHGAHEPSSKEGVVASGGEPQTSDSHPSDEEVLREQFQLELAALVANNPLQIGIPGNSSAVTAADELIIRHNILENVSLVIHLGNCETANAPRPCKLYIEDSRNGNRLIWLSQNFASEPILPDGSGLLTLDVVATDFLVGDFGGTFGNVAIDAPSKDALDYLRFQLDFESSEVRVKSLELLRSGV